MSPLSAPIVAAILAGASAAQEDFRIAYGAGPAAELGALSSGALPTPPAVVVRQTKRYGEVTIDHAKHVAARAPCRSCHHSGAVSKIEFTPQIAHRACVGCHKAQGTGPTQCAGCHVRSLPPEEFAAEVPPPRAASSLGLAASPGFAANESAPPSGPPSSSHDCIELGLVSGPSVGLAIRASSRQERLIRMYSFERFARRDGARLLGMLGAGLTHPIAPRWAVAGLAMAGLDAVERPAVSVVPALALRAAVEYSPRQGRIDTIHLGVTGAVDVVRPSAFRTQVPRTSLFATVTAGFDVRGWGRR